MKQDHPIRHAIDESLSSIRFNAKDQRIVLRAIRDYEDFPACKSEKRPRFQFAFAMAMTLLLLLPIGALTLRLSGTGIPTAPVDLIIPASSPAATAYPQYASSDNAGEINQAVAIARTCFETVCDTSIYSFDEYTVEVNRLEHDGPSCEYTITMTSIYGNGCAFSVTVAMPEGEVAHYTTPALATTPLYFDSSQLQVKAWYDQYGPHLIAWPQDAQAEFSRRYEGALLRTAKEGEMTAEQAVKKATDLVRKHLPVQDGVILYGYSQLYAERSRKDGVAHYVVSVFSSAVTDPELPSVLGTVTFKTDGSDVVVTLH